MANYDHIDIAWSWDGDYSTGTDGDIEDTSSDYIVSLEQEIRTIVRGEMGDWDLHRLLGANLSDFLGEPNTREVALEIEQRIISSLVTPGLVRQSDLTVRVVPVGPSIVLVIINVIAASTVNNSIDEDGIIKIVFTYDSMEDSVFFLPPSELERQAR